MQPLSRSSLRLLRPADWVKNVFLLPALLFSLPEMVQQEVEIVPLLIRLAIAIAGFCAIASGFYAINDVRDVASDRLHPVKRRRPVASGDVSVRTAAIIGAILVAGGLGTALAISKSLFAIFALYALLQVGYNIGLKKVMFLDVVGLATGFALRATAGAVAIARPMSIWLLGSVFFLCLYLGFIKRLCDLRSAERAGNSEWKSPAGYDDRHELNWLLSLSACMSIVTYLMYALSPHTRDALPNAGAGGAMGLALLLPLVMACMHRFYYRASRAASDSPLDALRTDRVALLSIVLFVIGILLILFVPDVRYGLQRIFFIDRNDLAGTFNG